MILNLNNSEKGRKSKEDNKFKVKCSKNIIDMRNGYFNYVPRMIIKSIENCIILYYVGLFYWCFLYDYSNSCLKFWLINSIFLFK